MKTLKLSLLALSLIATVAVSAQSGNVKVDKYAELFEMSEEQAADLKEIYVSLEEEEKVIADKMVAQRQALQSVSNSPQDKAAWKTKMDALIQERREFNKKRDALMVELMTAEQEKAWDMWQSGEIDRKEIPNLIGN